MKATQTKTTKAQERTMAKMEVKYGMEVSHHLTNGNPVMVDRVKNVWVEIERNGNHRPA
jgi:hypothetical protein